MAKQSITSAPEAWSHMTQEFVALALAEKVSALDTVDYLRQRAAQADVTDFDRILDMVPDIEPDAHDRLPS